MNIEHVYSLEGQAQNEVEHHLVPIAFRRTRRDAIAERSYPGILRNFKFADNCRKRSTNGHYGPESYAKASWHSLSALAGNQRAALLQAAQLTLHSPSAKMQGCSTAVCKFTIWMP